jgi:hypothetical protein
MEPENQNTSDNVFGGIGTKNPAVHVLDSLMGMGKSTALIEMIKADVADMWDRSVQRRMSCRLRRSFAG